ncbi:GntR family transcriptional regulator [Actinoplanes couchii]|uniref:GntR family transcriptional regulator n=1 Tax=Actinoplanes couchii TaxID=403638 RepID=A0ABQ3XPV2_9ACTN|nr:GntR family transcriptional regulator [Actinoplanes couchii]MDR6323829.1 GntR family transcriptional regulator [Actinoplanes couchii]GID60536.1 GntR family transcriptional regulator [Actinoplanes couchii]
MSRVPAYRQIALDLTDKIRTGVFRPGEALPAQRDLSAQYGVTLMTLRQALSSLRDDGLIVQQAGRGTFVAPVQATYRVDTLRSFVEDLREQGQDVTTEVVSVAAENGLRLERVRYLGDQPVIHQISWVPEPHGSRVSDEDFRRMSLYVALAETGVTIVRASERIVPGLLDPVSAARLRRPAGSAVFVSERTTYAMDDEPVVTDRAVILGDLMEIRAERAATRVSVQWGTVRDRPNEGSAE